MPRRYIRKADRIPVAVPSDETLVARFFMEAPITEALTAHRWAGHIVRQRSLAATLNPETLVVATPTGTEIGRTPPAPKLRRRRKTVAPIPVDQPLPGTEVPQYDDDPESVGSTR
jgi:hypothetical protein